MEEQGVSSQPLVKPELCSYQVTRLRIHVSDGFPQLFSIPPATQTPLPERLALFYSFSMLVHSALSWEAA